MKSILRVFLYLRRYPAMAAVQLFCAVGMTLAVFVFPNATGHVIDKVIPDPSRHHEFLFWTLVALAHKPMRRLWGCIWVSQTIRSRTLGHRLHLG